ncbi:hypothetical protein Tco_0028529 [Tanacetum coccineum]
MANIIIISSSSEDITDNQSEGKVTKVNEGSSKRKLTPLGSAERPRPEDTYFRSPEKETKENTVFEEFPDDSDYESSNNETKIKNNTSNISIGNTLLIYEDSIEKYVPLERLPVKKPLSKALNQSQEFCLDLPIFVSIICCILFDFLFVCYPI